ncbi:site-2 protease family protein [Candidatus Falkowbacteria bacterium]|nr:site-2 protease family protein [Candidatus Falkowbacteria bacterium]
MSILLFIIILSLLVLAHEWGHFYTARRFKMGVEEFGIGFPPRAWSKVKDGITYSLNWLPLGGFVKIKGEDGQHVTDADSFMNFPAYKRVIVLVAGVVMNFLVAAILLGVGYMFGLPQDVAGVDPALIKERQIKVLSAVSGYGAYEAGIKGGDQIVSFDSQPVHQISELVEMAGSKIDSVVKVGIVRDGESKIFDVKVSQIAQTGRGGIGVSLFESGIVAYPWYRAIPQGFVSAGVITKDITVGFGHMIKGLFTKEEIGGVAGPVGIAVMTGEVATLGWIYLLQFTAMLSLNLAVLNMVPFPALDGGRVLFVIIEKISRKRVSHSVEGMVHATGFLILMLLIIVITFKDVMHLFVK